jgi:hypothetical protein
MSYVMNKCEAYVLIISGGPAAIETLYVSETFDIVAYTAPLLFCVTSGTSSLWRLTSLISS